MNGAQIHLMLNHTAVIGMPMIAFLWIAGALARSSAVLRVGLLLAVLVALATIGTFLSGEPAEKIVEKLPGISESSIERHEDAARAAMAAVQVVGLAALAGLIAFRGRQVPRGLGLTLAALGIVVAAWLAWTAHLGGLIHHPELRPGAVAADRAEAEDDHR